MKPLFVRAVAHGSNEIVVPEIEIHPDNFDAIAILHEDQVTAWLEEHGGHVVLQIKDCEKALFPVADWMPMGIIGPADRVMLLIPVRPDDLEFVMSMLALKETLWPKQ